MSIIRTYYDFERLIDNAFYARFPVQGQVQQRQLTRRDSSGRFVFQPRMDIHEDAKANTVTATKELPGLKKEDVSIDVHNNRLTVSGESKTSSEREEDGYAIRECSYGSFSRSLHLPTGIKPEEVKAWMECEVPQTTPERPEQT